MVLHPGSARTEKFWLAERWAEVANHLQASGLPVVLTGGTSRMEKDHLARIKALVTNPVIDLSGKLNLLAVAALIQRARLLATVDSAPMHLAGALGTPQIILSGPPILSTGIPGDRRRSFCRPARRIRAEISCRSKRAIR